MACQALSQVRDLRVRAVATREIQLPRHPGLRDILRLFLANWEPGDETLIGGALWVPGSAEETHGIACGLADLLRFHPSDPALANLALWVYEQNPCSHCRRGAVEQLLAAGTIPDWVRAEAQRDGDEGIRGLVGAESAEG